MEERGPYLERYGFRVTMRMARRASPPMLSTTRHSACRRQHTDDFDLAVTETSTMLPYGTIAIAAVAQKARALGR
jgi:hypothetical protein